MPPAFRSATSGNGALPVTVTKPSGVINGDLLLVAFASYDSSGSAVQGAPGGWTALRQINPSGTSVRTGVYWKIAASEPSSWTFTGDTGWGACFACIAISDPGNPSSPFADEDGQLSGAGSVTTITAPSIDAGSTTDLLVYAGMGRGGAAGWTPPAGYTERADQDQSGSSVSLTVATKEPSGAAGATGTVSATIAVGYSGNKAAYLIAVAGAAPPPPSGTFTTIKFGTGLTVTDEGGGVIRVDA